MQKLLQFLKKFRDFLIFFVLQVIVLSFFFNQRNYHRSAMTNTSSGAIGWFIEKKHNITQHFNLSKANEILVAENAKLRAQLPESFYTLQGNVFSVNDTLKKQYYRYIPATVINSSSNKRNNYFTLNRGEAQGIEIGMGVVSDAGVIGVVTDVSQNFSIVMTILSENIRINAKLKKNNEYWLVSWDGRDNSIAQIAKVKRDISFEVGDEVITRGGATQFPEGIPVGKISEVIAEDGEQTIALNIKLAVNYNAVYHVYIVENLLKDEQLNLEGRILGDE